MRMHPLALLALLPLCATAATNAPAGAGSSFAPPPPTVATTNRLVWIGGAVDHFDWKEISPNGSTFLTEDGWLVGLVGGAQAPLVPGWLVEGRAKFYTGLVDYDGSLQTLLGNRDYKSKTTYVGFEGELLARRPLPGRTISLQPFAGAGLAAWQRELDTDTYGDIGQYGYTETWSSLLALLGTDFAAGPWRARLALRLPLLNEESVEIDHHDVELEPGRTPGYQVEVAYTRGPWHYTLGFTADDYERSDLDDSGRFLQPESERRLVSVQVGRAF